MTIHFLGSWCVFPQLDCGPCGYPLSIPWDTQLQSKKKKQDRSHELLGPLSNSLLTALSEAGFPQPMLPSQFCLFFTAFQDSGS